MRHSIMFVFVLFFGMAVPKPGYTQIAFGVKGGLNVSEIRSDGFHAESHPAFHAGVASEVDFTETFFLRAEVLYSVKGWKFEDLTMDLRYLNMPILLGYRPVSAFSILIGPELGYLLKAVRKPDAVEIPPYEKFDYGVAVGAAYEITEQLAVEARFIRGFDTLVKAEGRDVNNQPTGQIYRSGANRTFQFSLLYFFSITD